MPEFKIIRLISYADVTSQYYYKCSDAGFTRGLRICIFQKEGLGHVMPAAEAKLLIGPPMLERS
jgi:hypothetical protein